MNIKVSSNAAEVIEGIKQSLEDYQKNVEFTMFRAISLLEAEILENLRSRSGLHVRSGALLNSIGASKRVFRGEHGDVLGEIGTQGIPYAAAHEFGVITRPHDIRPRNAKALAFMFGGNQTFAKVVHHPGSKIPARPYLRPALAATQDKIIAEFGLFLKASFEEKK